MRTFVLLFLSLVSATSHCLANTDPCDLNHYPIKWQSELKHPVAYTMPAIYYENNGSKIFVSATDAITFLTQNMSEQQPYLKNAKRQVLETLQQLDNDDIVNYTELLSPFDGLEPEKLNTAIHIMAAYEGMFEGLLLNQKAVVKIREDIVLESNAKFMVGNDPNTLGEFKSVNKLYIWTETNSIFTKCWLTPK